jgi:eukaryotic-like serine/threonine-protein kinase
MGRRMPPPSSYPSTGAASAQTADIATVADARGTIPSKLSKQLSGDLDNIILMALRKEPSRRYASVEQFAEDIRRSLNDLPVAARNDSVAYRTSKFIQRHRVGVAASLAVGISLVSGLGLALHERNVARQQRARAERRFNDVRSLANSLIFDVHDSIKELPGSTPARKIIVDRALQYLNGLVQESAGDVGLQRELAAAYERVGAVQGDYLENNLGDSEGTLVSYQKGLEIRKQIDSASSDWTDHLALAQSHRLVAHQMWATGDLRSARQQIDQAIAISENLSRTQPDNLKILYELSFDHEVSGAIGFPDDPSPDQKTLQEYRRALAADEASLRIQPDDVRTLHGYSIDLSHIGGMLEGSDPQGALEYYRNELAINQKLAKLSPELRYKRSIAIAYGSIASVYDDLGDYANAVENDLKDLAIYKEMIQSDPKNALLRQGLAITYANTATAMNRTGKTASAIDYSTQAVDIMRPLVAAAPKNTRQQFVLAAVLASRATILLSARKWAAASQEFESARSIYESLANGGEAENRVNVAACDVKLGESSGRSGRDQAAEKYFQRALSIAEPSLSKTPADLDALYVSADAYAGLGDLRMKAAQQSRKQSDWSAARAFYLQSQATWRRIDHPNHTAPNSFEVGDPKDVTRHLHETELALAPAGR